MSPEPRGVSLAGSGPDIHRLSPTDPLRLLPYPSATSYDEHLQRYGALGPVDAALIDEIEHAGLVGRGGAGFPTATKLRAVASRGRRPVLVANGTEGEPASAKDKILLRAAPHLVLDGIEVVTELLGARETYLCVEHTHPEVLAALDDASAERSRARAARPGPELLAAPNRYVAGEETALVHWLNGGEAKPQFVPPRPFERGVGGRPTFTSNVETFAQVALVARFGASWYRSLGTPTAPGTTLLTVAGAVAQPGVCEAPGGCSIQAVIDAAGGAPGGVQAVLIGGYFGTWIPGAAVADVTIDPASLSAHRASLGCGVVAVLPEGACPLVEVSRVTRWLAEQNAGQCGPCVHGLPALADAVERATGGRAASADQITGLIGLVEGRGACRHPDGVARFVTSSLRVFGDHLTRHLRHGRCPEQRGWLPVPETGGWR